MTRRYLDKVAIPLFTGLMYMAMGLSSGSVIASYIRQAPELKITVGEPTLLTTQTYQNRASVAASRTGTVAAFYPTNPHSRRISTDAGLNWGPASTYTIPGPMSVGLREGGVVIMGWHTSPVGGGVTDRVEIYRFESSDDFLSWEEIETATIHVPNYMPSLDIPHLQPHKGKIVQLPSGNLLMPMYGGFEGDSPQIHRAFLVESADQGRTWDYYSTISYEPADPNPGLPGQYLGACEPSIALLSNGQMLAMLRTQYSHVGPDYRPMYTAWSDDMGLTWTTMIPTDPYLYNVYPTLQVLDNGVVAVEYGRPGLHVAFSIDNGHTWPDSVSFSDLPEPVNTGYGDMVKVGLNKLVLIGSDGEGTKIWPITVDIQGDFDGDGDIDGDDFLLWQRNFPVLDGTAGSSSGDANGDGDVDGDDFLVWQRNFPYPTAISSVPEPNSLAMLALGGLMMLRRRSRIQHGR